MIKNILTLSFYLLFFLIPLLWTPWNFELFEYNKMMAVYFLTILIIAVWLIQTVRSKTLIIKRTPLDIPILLFLGANILSTIFSIDKHTSIWGYYSRSNGGLISIASYIILYYVFVSNFELPQILKFLKAALWGGFLVSLWAILEHFGVSPSCIILTGQANASCWVQDVASRVFATLGQPNWLAAYLAMLIFPAFYFLLTAKNKLSFTTYYILLTTYYLAFTFTYSRGATLGLLAGFAVFLPIILWLHLGGVKLKMVAFTLASFLIINILFGSALTDFRLVSRFAAPARPGIELTPPAGGSGTQLENGGTESGQIRLIVWQGALEIFKRYPIFGSGVETFAYSYYRFRPAQHNLTSEWDFLYNKAHNEFLNYLATTGILGFSSYIIIIITFVIVITKYQASLIIKKVQTKNLLLFSLFASYIGNLVQSFFGFSVVDTNLFFFLFPAAVFIAISSTKSLSLKVPSLSASHPKLFQGIILISASFLIFNLAKNYLADISFAEGSKEIDTNPGKAYNDLTSAVMLNPNEPLYQSELGYAASSASVSLENIDSTLSGKLKNQAIKETEKVLNEHPNNVSYFRTAIRTYYLLSTFDPAFTQKTLETFDKAIFLAPTDAKFYYNKGVVLDGMGKKNEAIKVIKEALKLKSNYAEAKDALEKIQIK